MIKEIHTGFYSDEAKYVFERLFDVIKNNTYYVTKRQRSTASVAKISKAANGEIVLVDECNSWYTIFCKFNNNVEARGWLAWQLKICVYNELERQGDAKHKNWNRANTDVLKYFSGKVADMYGFMKQTADNVNYHDVPLNEIYCMYDLLNSRQKTDRRYDAKLIEKLVGHENDPFTTEQENVRRNEIDRLNKEKNSKILALQRERDVKITQMRQTIYNEYTKLIDESKAEYDEQIKQLNEAFSQMAAIAAA